MNAAEIEAVKTGDYAEVRWVRARRARDIEEIRRMIGKVVKTEVGVIHDIAILAEKMAEAARRLE